MIGHFYEVEKIIDKRKIKDSFEYLIKWKGYSIKDSTWEPEYNLFTIQDLIDEFNTEKASKNYYLRKKRKGHNKKKFAKKKIKKKEESDNMFKIMDNNKPYFMLDNSIDEILGVKLEKNELVGIVKKRDKNGKVYTEKISTEDIKKTNPWILVDFYESKIVMQ